MVGFKDILVAVIKKIKNGIPGVTIESQDVEEGFNRPSFFIELDNIKIEDFMSSFQDRTLTARIIYFPSDKNKNQQELLEVMDKLNDVFVKESSMAINDETLVEVEAAETKIVDKILHFSFDIRLSEAYLREITVRGISELSFK
ncbi:MAG: phage tail terminator family protein [Fusobacteriaceae bacterium]